MNSNSFAIDPRGLPLQTADEGALHMNLAKRMFPHARDSHRRKQFRDLQAALALGAVCAALFGLMLYLLYIRQHS